MSTSSSLNVGSWMMSIISAWIGISWRYISSMLLWLSNSSEWVPGHASGRTSVWWRWPKSFPKSWGTSISNSLIRKGNGQQRITGLWNRRSSLSTFLDESSPVLQSTFLYPFNSFHEPMNDMCALLERFTSLRTEIMLVKGNSTNFPLLNFAVALFLKFEGN